MLISAEDENFFLGQGKKTVPHMLVSISEKENNEGTYAY
jgi:hypothetical protein